MIHCVDVNANLFLRFIEEVLTQYFSREYLRTYINICRDNSNVLLGKILIDNEMDQIIGGALGRIQTTYKVNNNNNNNHVLYIEMLAISGRYKRSGFGLKILKEMERTCQDKNVTTIELHVSFGNLAAILFYYKNNFKLISVHKHFYQNVKDFQGSKTALLLSKSIVNINPI